MTSVFQWRQGGDIVMTKRLPADPAPGPLEGYAARLDDLFDTLAGRQACRRYLEGLLLPTERNKTLTALANTEPVLGAQRKEAQGGDYARRPENRSPGRRRTGSGRDRGSQGRQSHGSRGKTVSGRDRQDRQWGRLRFESLGGREDLLSH